MNLRKQIIRKDLNHLWIIVYHKKRKIPRDKRYYQYTCIDEASRERFLHWYEEHTPENTVDFVNRCIKYYRYKPEEIQTDNGEEFTYNRSNIKKKHPLEELLKELGIKTL